MSPVDCRLFFFTLEMIVMYFHASMASQVNQASFKFDLTLCSCLLASEVQNIRPSRQTLLFSATFPHGSQAVCCGTLSVECLLLSWPWGQNPSPPLLVLGVQFVHALPVMTLKCINISDSNANTDIKFEMYIDSKTTQMYSLNYIYILNSFCCPAYPFTFLASDAHKCISELHTALIFLWLNQ